MADWSKGLSGNAGLFFAAMQASKAGFAVAVTSRNMEGPDLILLDKEGNTYPLQVKSFAGKAEDVSGFGKGVEPNPVREPYWAFVAGAMTDSPRCYVLTREQVAAKLGQDPGTRSGKPAEERLWWFGARRFCKAEHPDELVDCIDAWRKLLGQNPI
jgi:hypothetical protein